MANDASLTFAAEAAGIRHDLTKAHEPTDQPRSGPTRRCATHYRTSTTSTICRAVNLQCSCGCKIQAKNPIRHCLDGARLQFTCEKFSLPVVNTIKKPFQCQYCCGKAIDQAQSKLRKASDDYEAARARGDERTMRVTKTLMDRANKDFSSEASKHARCAAAREKDKD